jgi:hypothetical protein
VKFEFLATGNIGRNTRIAFFMAAYSEKHLRKFLIIFTFQTSFSYADIGQLPKMFNFIPSKCILQKFLQNMLTTTGAFHCDILKFKKTKCQKQSCQFGKSIASVVLTLRPGEI